MKGTLHIKVVLFVALFAYSWIVSQSFMYVIALEKTQLAMNAASYIELRQLLDSNFRETFKFAIIGALLSNLLLVLVTMRNYRSMLFIASSVSLLLLIGDTLLTVKGNFPINDVINTWTASSHPASWSEFRSDWLRIFRCRQLLNVSGFVILLAGAVFGSPAFESRRLR